MNCICGQPAASRCAKCQRGGYCSRACQVSDWKRHRIICRTPDMLENTFSNVIDEIRGNIQQFVKHNTNVVHALISETLTDFLQNSFHFIHLTCPLVSPDVSTPDVSTPDVSTPDASNIQITIRLQDYTVIKTIKKEDIMDVPNPGSEWTIYIDKTF